MKIKLLVLSAMFIIIQQAYGGEFVIMNTTYTYPSNANSFFLHSHPDASMPSNWLVPDDYWHGNIYAYFEVIDVPTNEPFGFQMGVFQYYPSIANWDGHNYYETCSFAKPELRGEGDFVEFNYGSPASWWQHPNGAVDFARVYDFQSVGPVIWSLVPGAVGNLSPTSGGGVDAAWAIRSNWFPCTVRVIIVAVSAGSTFSGWQNYMGGCSVPSQPGSITGSINPNQGSSQTYSIAAVSGATSYSWTLPAGWTGTSTTNSITTTIGSSSGNISVKANNSCGSGTARTLSVTTSCNTPAQPGAITGNSNPIEGSSQTYSIAAVSGASSYSWTLPAGWTGTSTTNSIITTVGSSDGTISATAGNYCGSGTARTLAVTVACSPIQQSAPSYGINFGMEVTNKVVSVADEYAHNISMSGAVSGNGQVLPLTPGQNIYFRTRASLDGCYTASAVQTLIVPERPGEPVFTVDFIHETTVENVGTDIDYTSSPSYQNPVSGTGAKIGLTPGQDLYLWKKHTVSSFASTDQHLLVPERPSTPVITINYPAESTSEIPVTLDWSVSADMANNTAGTGTSIPVTPGTDLYFRTRATSGSFKSSVQKLDVSARPAAPTFTVDFDHETTIESVESTVEYSVSPSFTGSLDGSGNKVSLTPGQNLYFRLAATQASFASDNFMLNIPVRPAIPAITINFETEMTSDIPATMDWSVVSTMEPLSSGIGSAIAVTPGTDLFFRIRSTATDFASIIQALDVPERPILEYTGNDTITSSAFEIKAILDNSIDDFELPDLSVTNGIAQNLQPDGTFEIVPEITGDVKIIIPSYSFTSNGFASNEIMIYYIESTTDMPESEDDSFRLWPNPCVDGTIYIETTFGLPYSVGIFTYEGGLIRLFDVNTKGIKTIQVQNLPAGLYLIKLNLGNKVRIYKIIIE